MVDIEIMVDIDHVSYSPSPQRLIPYNIFVPVIIVDSK